MLALSWMLACPLAVARRRSGWRIPRVRARSLAIEGGLALAAVPVVVGIESALMEGLLRLFGEGASSGSAFDSIAGTGDLVHPIALAVLAIAFAPFAEEVCFRGMLYNALRTRLGPAPAALLQALAFGLLHPFGPAERAIIAAFGLVLAGLAEWRKSLVAPILLHSLMNVLAMALMFLTIIAAANAPILGIRGKPDPRGCLVEVVLPNTPAENSGLQPGDILTTVAGSAVKDLRDVARVMRLKKAGDQVEVDFLRDGKALRVDATLQARPK